MAKPRAKTKAKKVPARTCVRNLVALEDLDDAVNYYNDSYESDEPVDTYSLKEVGVSCVEPESHIFDTSYFGHEPKGWLRKIPESEWAKELKSNYSRPFDHIIKQWRDGTLRPGIEINDQFGDGAGRATFFWGIGEAMPVAKYRTK